MSESKEMVVPDNEEIENMPENLMKEYRKYLLDPKKYARMYPVAYKVLLPYLNIKK